MISALLHNNNTTKHTNISQNLSTQIDTLSSKQSDKGGLIGYRLSIPCQINDTPPLKVVMILRLKR